MTKIIKSKYKCSRRLGVSIWGREKDAFNKKNYRPGQHGREMRGKMSDYGLGFRAKQRFKAIYGRITEKQLRNTFIEARRMHGNTSENLFALVELRLDSVIYRSGFAPTIFAARQLVSHGHITVNGKVVNIPSFRLKLNDAIEIKEESRRFIGGSTSHATAPFLHVEAFSVKILSIPRSEDIQAGFDIELHRIVEFYSR